MPSRGPAPAKTSVFVGGCRPRDPGNINYILFVIASGAKQSSNLCRRTATHIIHWIATVAMLPRDDKELVINVSLGRLCALCVSSYLFKLR